MPSIFRNQSVAMYPSTQTHRLLATPASLSFGSPTWEGIKPGAYDTSRVWLFVSCCVTRRSALLDDGDPW
jgi:hypothetical protein